MSLINKRLPTIFFIIFLIAFLIINININGCNGNKEIPISKFSQNVGVGPTMTFLYCYSCGYRKAFEEYVNILNNKYPDILIKGYNYDPPGFNMYLSKIILIMKILLIIIIISSFNIFTYVNLTMPIWWQWCVDNKLYACMMIFFLGNIIEAQLISSGAFEISFNDVPVWSKLQTGRIPAPQELFQIIDSHLQFSDKIDKNPDFVK